MSSRDSEIGVTIATIIKTNEILKNPVNKLFPFENTYQDTSQTGLAKQQKLTREAAVIGEIKRKVNCVNIGGRSLSIINMNLLTKFYKTREIFLSVTRVSSILLTTSTINTSVEGQYLKST